jgi:hypothetical protein
MLVLIHGSSRCDRQGRPCEFTYRAITKASHRLAQSFRRLSGPVFLNKIKGHADHDDGTDNEEAGGIAGERALAMRRIMTKGLRNLAKN